MSMSKYQIIQVDNLTVRKVNLTSGENIVGQINADNAVGGAKVEQAVKINVSTNDEMTITPCEGISCYIKNCEARRWKQLGANWTVPLRAQDTCLLLPARIWIKVIPKMDQVDEINSPKRKPEETLENEPPDKRPCTDLDIEMGSKHALNNNVNDSDSIKNVNIDNVQENTTSEDINQDDVESSSLQDLNVNNKEEEQESIAEKETNEDSTAEFGKEQKSELESDCEKKDNKDLHSGTENHVNEDLNNSESKPEEQNADPNPINLNTDNIDQATSNTQSQPRVKCKYGSQCYRLNAEHKAEFSHPGDPDYDTPDNRPECPYGLDCYRKNPQHKLDYKHTQSKRKRTQTTARPASPQDLSDLEDSWEESVDESDYDPSFIDDDSMEEFESDFDDDNEKED